MKFSRSALLALSAAPLLQADFETTKWHWRRSLVPPAVSATAKIDPDRTLYQGSQAELRDVRILRDGAEVPYTVVTHRAASVGREVPATIRNRSAVPGLGLQFTLDAGDAARHNRVRMETRLHDFKRPVRIETSGDGGHWAVVRNDGSIFDVSRADQPASGLAVDYPDSTQRFVRVTILGWRDPQAITAAWLSRVEERSEIRNTVVTVAAPKQVEQPDTQSSEVTLDFGARGIPHDKVIFDIAESAFSRSVGIDTGNNGKDWNYTGRGTIWRSSDGGRLNMTFNETWDRYLRIGIENHDDRPLTVKSIRVEAITRSILFPASATGTYWLYYGNAGAREPVYDLAAIVSEGGGAVAARLGPEEPNPGYREPEKPMSERNPGVLYALLGVAIAVMGYVTVRFLRTVQRNGAG